VRGPRAHPQAPSRSGDVWWWMPRNTPPQDAVLHRFKRSRAGSAGSQPHPKTPFVTTVYRDIRARVRTAGDLAATRVRTDLFLAFCARLAKTMPDFAFVTTVHHKFNTHSHTFCRNKSKSRCRNGLANVESLLDAHGDGLEQRPTPQSVLAHKALRTGQVGLSSSSRSDYQQKPVDTDTPPCVVKVFGVGGGGCNAISRMLEDGEFRGVRFAIANTDHQALIEFKKKYILYTQNAVLETVVPLGESICRGLGAGGNPEVGCAAAEESHDRIAQAIGVGTDLLFITAGMGGGTGTGAAPVVARIAKSLGALTVGVVTKPFSFEGRHRMQQALDGVAALRENVDTLIVVSNDRLMHVVPKNMPLKRAFRVADDVLKNGVRGISELITRPGLINVDFADVRSVMAEKGYALLGLGTGSGERRAKEAALAAVSSPLLDFPLNSAKGAVFNICGGPDMTLSEVNQCAEVIFQHLDPDASIIFGATVDPTLGPRADISVTVVATGFAS